MSTTLIFLTEQSKYSTLFTYFYFLEISQIFLATKYLSPEKLDFTHQPNKIKSANLNVVSDTSNEKVFMNV